MLFETLNVTYGAALDLPDYCVIAPTYTIGDIGPAGGVVFYISPEGEYGMEVAPDTAIFAPWGCENMLIAGADGGGVGSGSQNTTSIVADCTDAGTAASIADTYSFGGYSDWFLPSIFELNALLLFSGNAGYGGTADYHWSSTQVDAQNARSIHFGNGFIYYAPKRIAMKVRLVREFTLSVQ